MINHILEHGFITTEELETVYGYKHPPRAVRDVREQGVPIESFTTKNAQGQSIAAYRFGDPLQIQRQKIGGRKNFPKSLKVVLISAQGNRCSICSQRYETPYLQVDHRIPYEVTGESQQTDNSDAFMLLCRSCNRAKSWTCEHCQNGIRIKDPIICTSCYWARPANYTHIAMQPIRRIDLIWSDGEINDYDKLKQMAENSGEILPEYIKKILRNYLSQK